MLIGTGVMNSWCLVGSFHALWYTTYGQCLLVKLGLFGAMLPLAAWNMLVVRKRLGHAATAAEGGAAPAGGVIGQLRLLVGIEVVLGILVIVDVGVLGLLAPGRV